MTVRTALAAAALLLLAGCATPERVVSPVWAGPAETPDGKEFTPERATLQGVNGHVMLLCRARGIEGRVGDCRVAYESPRGWGFGSAALRMIGGVDTRRSKTPPRADGLVLIPIKFCADSDPACPPPPGGFPVHWGDPRLDMRMPPRTP